MSEVEQDWSSDPTRPQPRLDLLPPLNVSSAPPAVPGPQLHYGRALLLLLATIFTMTTLGPTLYVLTRTDVVGNLDPWLSPRLIAWVWTHRPLLELGLSFSLPAVSILLAHELGHYLMCRRRGLAATLPYFLPLPVWLGTLGAFIRIRAPFRNKRDLFDVGIAGPLAGFVALLPFLFIGVARSVPGPLQLAVGETLLLPGSSLAMRGTNWLLHGPLPSGTVLNLHPMALAAWFGLLATALNLIPLSQLDGGHILYAAIGRRQRQLALPIWVALALASFYWPGWAVSCAITAFIGLYHPPVVDEHQPLDRRRRWLAVGALIIFIVALTPYPLEVLEGAAGPPSGDHGLVVSGPPPPPVGALRAATLRPRAGRSGSPVRR